MKQKVKNQTESVRKRRKKRKVICFNNSETGIIEISDGFTHRPNRPWLRAPRFWGHAQLLSVTTHY